MVMVLMLAAMVVSPGAMAQGRMDPAETGSVRARVEPARLAQQKRKCFRRCTNVRVCRRVPSRVCQLQRYCQPRRLCTRSRVGNQIVQRCQSVCQWLTRRICRFIYRLQCRLQPRCQTVCVAVRG